MPPVLRRKLQEVADADADLRLAGRHAPSRRTGCRTGHGARSRRSTCAPTRERPPPGRPRALEPERRAHRRSILVDARRAGQRACAPTAPSLHVIRISSTACAIRGRSCSAPTSASCASSARPTLTRRCTRCTPALRRSRRAGRRERRSRVAYMIQKASLDGTRRRSAARARAIPTPCLLARIFHEDAPE